MQYTSEQQKIIHHPGGHARIIAVAGSGKTQTLTAYVHQRLIDGVPARRLLVLMYNKSAQLDFERRLQALSTQQALPDVRTFHSLGYRICESLVRQGDMPSFNKKLLSDSEIEPILWRILRNCADASVAEDVLARKKKWVEPAMAYIELVKSSMDSPELVFEQSGYPEGCKFFIDAFYRFEEWRSDQQRKTFNDLLFDPVKLFLKESRLAAQFGGHMQEIIVDEYQDINPVQQYLLDTLQGGKASVMVVGDPDQTIYEFRGSNPTLLTDGFSERYSPLHDYQLSHTFRFGDALSLVANQVIASNYSNEETRTLCLSHSSTSATNAIIEPSLDSAQTALKHIRQWSQDRPLSDIAVINRLWANSARLELCLLSNGVAYRMDNQQTVLERYELRPFRVLLQIANGKAFEWDTKTRRKAWQVLLTQPYLKIKKSIIDQMVQHLTQETMRWGQALRNAVPESLSKYQSEELFERARWIEKAERGQGEAYRTVNGWIQGTDYFSALKDNAFSAAQVDDQVDTVKAFAQFIRQSKWTLAEGGERLAELAALKTPDDADAVLITSIHKSKGREWPCVLIPEVNERFFPYQPEGEMMLNSTLASERRLLYVAMTRAQRDLVFIVPTKDANTSESPLLTTGYVRGAQQFVQQHKASESTFKLPVDMHQASVKRYAQAKNVTNISWQGKPPPTDLSRSTVKHPTLGIGQIVKATEDRLWIEFLRDRKTKEFSKEIVLPLLTVLPE